ncbi:MAG: hypothetical protein HC875_39680 [Anaerolineales bacterium]|nr:hypothetical protein [Anaerolineales bacterium]
MTGNGHGNGQLPAAQPMTLEQVAGLMPQFIALVDRTLDVNSLKKQTVSQVLDQLEAKASEADKPLAAQAKAILTLLPILADMNFEDVYLRYTAK